MVQLKETTQEKTKKNRRALLKKGIGATVAVAGVGAVAAIQATKGTAHASGPETATQFTDTVVPVVSVTNTSSNAAARIGGDIYGMIGQGSAIGVVGANVAIPTDLTGPFEAGVTGFGLGSGVVGHSNSANGVTGLSDGGNGIGVFGRCDPGTGVQGEGQFGVFGASNNGTGVVGRTIINGIGVLAQADNTIGVALSIKGKISVGEFNSTGNSPAGTATIADKTSSVTVTNHAATPNSIVILTPLSDPGGTLWVTSAPGSFDINRSVSKGAVTIAYLIIN